MDDQLKAKWERGKNNTLRFYRAKMPWKAKAFNTELLYLPDYFDKMISDKKEVTIAEIGSGMFCTIGSLWKTAKIKIIPSDALATEFNQMLKECGVTPLIPVEKQDMLNLTYKDSSFDIVHCTNALDHTRNPLRAISEMYRIVKQGGYIYLRHFPNVGEHERYSGLHMWNIDKSGDSDCVIWNLSEKHLLSNYFKGFVTIKKRELDYEPDDMVVSILHKE